MTCEWSLRIICWQTVKAANRRRHNGRGTDGRHCITSCHSQLNESSEETDVILHTSQWLSDNNIQYDSEKYAIKFLVYRHQLLTNFPNSFTDTLCSICTGYIIYGRSATQCRCEPEVVSVHLFTLASMVVCFAADCKCRFFCSPCNTKEYKKWEDSVFQILIPQKRNDLCNRHCKQKISWTALCHLKMS